MVEKDPVITAANLDILPGNAKAAGTHNKGVVVVVAQDEVGCLLPPEDLFLKKNDKNHIFKK